MNDKDDKTSSMLLFQNLVLIDLKLSSKKSTYSCFEETSRIFFKFTYLSLYPCSDSREDQL